MWKKLILVLLTLTIQACAVSVSEKNIVLQDSHQIEITAVDIENIKQLKGHIDVELISLKRTDGATAKGLWIKQPGSNTVVIYFSGNTTRIKEAYNKLLPELLSLKTDVVWLDHRGMGASDGQSSVSSLYQDGLHTYDYVSSRTNKNIVLHGVSLGSFVAGHVATTKPISGLVLEASATNTDDWIDSRIPWYMKPITDVNVDHSLKTAGNEQVVEQYKGPLFILVGEHDKVTPIQLSQKLYDKSQSIDKHILVVKNRKHGNALGDDGAKDELRGFIQRL